jgi:catechol 2,3-dioxygenase-like lactoylglutathione lyase family enzyme
MERDEFLQTVRQADRYAVAVTTKIGSIVIHCHEFDRTVAFWQQALGYVPREPARGGWVVLRDSTGAGPNLSFQARDRPRKGRGWIHLDLYTADGQSEVERLVALGARRYDWRYPPRADYVVLEDPDGNLFCVVQKVAQPATSAG